MVWVRVIYNSLLTLSPVLSKLSNWVASNDVMIQAVFSILTVYYFLTPGRWCGTVQQLTQGTENYTIYLKHQFMYVCQASWSTTGNYPIYVLMNGLHVVLNIPFKTLCRLSAGEFSFKRCLWTKETGGKCRVIVPSSRIEGAMTWWVRANCLDSKVNGRFYGGHGFWRGECCRIDFCHFCMSAM